MQDVQYITGCPAGELTPWLSTRFDLQAYRRGAALLSNFDVLPYGGIKRRHGTEYLGEAAEQGGWLSPPSCCQWGYRDCSTSC